MTAHLFLVLLNSVLLGAPTTASEEAIPRLDAEDATERGLARSEMIESRRRTIHSLINLADQEPTNLVQEYVKFDAVQLLGEYRATEATALLSKNLDYFPRCTVRVSEEGPLTFYPAAEALARIGAQAIERVVNQWTAGGISDRQRRILAFLIYQIDGKELGLARLELARKQAADESRKANLSRLIDLYERIDFANPREWPRPARRAWEELNRGRKRDRSDIGRIGHAETAPNLQYRTCPVFRSR